MTRLKYYGRIPHNHRSPIAPNIADPIYRNPNSFESMIEIFREIQWKNKLRKWIAIVMDGVPYVLGIMVNKNYIYTNPKQLEHRYIMIVLPIFD